MLHDNLVSATTYKAVGQCILGNILTATVIVYEIVAYVHMVKCIEHMLDLPWLRFASLSTEYQFPRTPLVEIII